MLHPAERRPRLICMSGLPGTGKSTLAQALAVHIGATWLRIDSIDMGLRESVLRLTQSEDGSYRAAAELAVDNLRLGRDVILDAVNPVPESRALWHSIPRRCDADRRDVEILCSDPQEHRRRVDARHAADPTRSTWADVIARDWVPWPTPLPRIDTAGLSIEEAKTALLAALDGAEGVSIQ